jgi:hypothetical protein
LAGSGPLAPKEKATVWDGFGNKAVVLPQTLEKSI